MKLLVIVSIALSGIIYAQSLPPELIPLSAKHKADSTALETQLDITIGRSRQSYAAMLDAAEKTATAAGRLSEIAAITKERERLTRPPTTDFPADLPKSLQTARKDYSAAVVRAGAERATRQERIDVDYLRALANLQVTKASNQEVMSAIASEKQRILSISRVAELQKRLINTAWEWSRGRKIATFHADHFSNSAGWEADWKATGTREITLTVRPHSMNRTITMGFDDTVQTYVGRDFDGTKLTGKRIK